jgi:hypothetical protein
MFASRNLLRVLLLTLLAVPRIAPAVESRDAESSVGEAPIQVILTDGAILSARCVQPAPFDMLAVIQADGNVRYVAPVRVRAIVQDGADRTSTLMDRHKTVGTPPPEPIRVRIHHELRVGPKSVTKSFLITETTYLGRVGHPDHRYGALQGYLGFDLGVMHNVTQRTAVAYGGFFGSGNDYASAGVRLRFRRWLTRTSNVEVAPGLVLAEGRTQGKPIHPGFSLQTSWSPSRYITLTVEGFSLRHRDREVVHNRFSYGDLDRDTGVLIGAKLGQWPGAVAGVVAALGVLAQSIPETYGPLDSGRY